MSTHEFTSPDGSVMLTIKIDEHDDNPQLQADLEEYRDRYFKLAQGLTTLMSAIHLIMEDPSTIDLADIYLQKIAIALRDITTEIQDDRISLSLGVEPFEILRQFLDRQILPDPYVDFVSTLDIDDDPVAE